MVFEASFRVRRDRLQPAAPAPRSVTGRTHAPRHQGRIRPSGRKQDRVLRRQASASRHPASPNARPRRAPFAGRHIGFRLRSARLTVYGHLPAANWIERTLRGRPPVLATTTLSAQLSAATSGIGLAVLPHFLGRQNDLVCLQSDLGIDQEIWLAIHSDLAQSRRVRVVATFLAELIQRSKAELELPVMATPDT